MVSKKYSQKLKSAIYRMINMDPNKRADGEEISELAKLELNKIKNQLKIDKSFVMEDIYFKLSLINYEEYFLKPLQLRPFDKIFFVNEEQSYLKTNKFDMFYLLANWLIDVIKNRGKPDVPVTQLNDMDNEAKVEALYTNLMGCGVKFTVIFTKKILTFGFGDEVCYILNDLTTEILIKKNYSFKEPSFIQAEGGYTELNAEEEILNEVVDIFQDNNQELESGKFNDYLSTSSTIKRPIMDSIECNVDPKEWYKEVENLRKELEESERNLTKNSLSMNELHYANLTEARIHSSIIRQFTNSNADTYSELSSSIWGDISKIMEFERRFQSEIPEEFVELSTLKSQSTELDKRVYKLSLSNKVKIEEYRKLKERYKEMLKDLEHKKGHTIERRGGPLDLRKAIDNIKKDIRIMESRIGILRSLLFKKDKQDKDDLLDSIMLGNSRIFHNSMAIFDDHRMKDVIHEVNEEADEDEHELDDLNDL